jgi:regulator of protease activity HflC (stomatin/prohibitin superfamily)
MADITRIPPFLRHWRGTPTMHAIHVVRGKVRHAGTGLSFWFRPLTAVLSEVPVDDRELPLLFHARTNDYQDVTVQATVTYRIADPGTAAARVDFSVEPDTGVWRGNPLDQIASLLTELAQQPALDLIATLPMAEAIARAVGPIRDRVAATLAGPGSESARLDETGIAVVGVRVVAVRPETEVERALQTPARESVQMEADRARYERRATAVERERAIAENELQSKIELAKRTEQLVAQEGANARRQAEEAAAAARVQVAAEAEQTGMRTVAEAERERTLGESRADATRAVGTAEAEAERARVAAYADLAPATLLALAARELAGGLPEIGQLTVTPDVLTGLVAKLAAASE